MPYIDIILSIGAIVVVSALLYLFSVIGKRFLGNLAPSTGTDKQRGGNGSGYNVRESGDSDDESDDNGGDNDIYDDNNNNNNNNRND